MALFSEVGERLEKKVTEEPEEGKLRNESVVIEENNSMIDLSLRKQYKYETELS